MHASVAVGLLTGRRAFGTSVLPCTLLFELGFGLVPAIEWRRGVARLALRERKPLGRDTAMNARVRIGAPAQRFPAVVRRPGPRRTINACGSSALLEDGSDEFVDGAERHTKIGITICVICGQIGMGGWPSCLCVFVFATWGGTALCSLCLCGFSSWAGSRELTRTARRPGLRSSRGSCRGVP